jgi:glycosyltransferase involved in cell wall biosynthesis
LFKRPFDDIRKHYAENLHLTNIVKVISSITYIFKQAIMSCPKHILVFVPYSFGTMDAAPRVRAYNIYNALNSLCDVTLVTGGLIGLRSLLKGNQTDISHLRFRSRFLNEFRCVIDKEMIRSLDGMYIEALASPLLLPDYWFMELVKNSDVPIFPFIRDLYWQYPGTLRETRWVKAWFNRCKDEMQWYLKNANGMLFPSSDMAETVSFSNKYVLPPAGDPSRCLNPQLPRKKIVTFVGGVSPKMGVDILARAMEIVIREHPDAHCNIVGNGDIDIVNQWCKKPYISHLPDRTYFDIPKILTDSNLTVIPHPNIPHNDFAIPVKLFDYMSSGRPVVATNCPSMAQFIEREQIGVVTEDNPESLAEGIIYLFDNPDLAQKYAGNALNSVKTRHSWRNRAKSLLNIMGKN